MNPIGPKKKFGTLLVAKKFLGEKNFGCKNILVAKKFWLQKNFGRKKIFVEKNFLVEKKGREKHLAH